MKSKILRSRAGDTPIRRSRGRVKTQGVLSASPPPPPASRGSLVRLQKVIAGSGLASRRKAEAMIAEGLVTVNGRVVREMGTCINPGRDHVKVKGRHLKPSQPYVYMMLNKPKGCVSSLSDPEGRPTIKDWIWGVSVRVFPVGRLDYDSEGLMLLTNHGAMAQTLLHPRYHVAKTYLVKVKGVLTNDEIATLTRGVQLDDGLTSPATVKKIRKAEQNSWLEVTIYEGRKHQVKRMFEAVGHPVLKLSRVRFGPLTLGRLGIGECRFLTDREANALRALLQRPNADGKRREVSGEGKKMKQGSRVHHLSSHPSPITPDRSQKSRP